MPSLRYVRLQAMLPLIIHRGEPKSALVIGFGTGITAGAVLHYPGLQKRVCVELLPAVVRAGEMFPENYKAWSDPRMQVRIGDGRQELLRSAERYDLITLEPPPAHPPKVSSISIRPTSINSPAKGWGRMVSSHSGCRSPRRTMKTRARWSAAFLTCSRMQRWTTELHEMLLVGSYSAHTTRLGSNRQPLQSERRKHGFAVCRHILAGSSARDLGDGARWLGTVCGARTPCYRRLSPHRIRSLGTTEGNYQNAAESARTRNRSSSNWRALMNSAGKLLSSVRVCWDFYTAGIAAYNGNRKAWTEAMRARPDRGRKQSLLSLDRRRREMSTSFTACFLGPQSHLKNLVGREVRISDK